MKTLRTTSRSLALGLALFSFQPRVANARQAPRRPPPPASEPAPAQSLCSPAELGEALLGLFPPAPFEYRLHSVRVLRACADARVAGPLGVALLYDPELVIRIEAAQILGTIDTPPARTVLRYALKRPGPVALRRQVVWSLEALGDTEMLREAVELDPEDEIRGLALQSLERRGDILPSNRELAELRRNAGPALTAAIARVTNRRAAAVREAEVARVAAEEADRQARLHATSPAPAPVGPGTKPAPGGTAPLWPPLASDPGLTNETPARTARPPRAPADGTALAVTTSILAGSVWGGGLSLLAQQESVGVVSLLGTAGAVIGGGTAWGLTRFGFRPKVGQALFYTTTTTWGTLAGLSAWAASGSDSPKLKYGLLVGGETVGVAAGLIGAHLLDWSPRQVLFANALVLGAGLGGVGVGRVRHPTGRLPVSPVFGYGAAPAMLAAAVASRYVDPSRADWELALTTSVAAGWSGGLIASAQVREKVLDGPIGQGALVAGLGFGYLAGTALGTVVEAPRLRLLQATVGMIVGNAVGLGAHMVLSPEDPERWSLGAGLGGVGMAAAALVARHHLAPGPRAPSMTLAGLAYGSATWALAAAASARPDQPEARLTGGMLSLGTLAGLGGYLGSRHFQPDAADQLTAAASAATGLAAGLGVVRLTTTQKGVADATGVLAGASVGLAAGAMLAHHTRLRPPEVGAGLTGAGYGLFFGLLAPTLNDDRFGDGRRTEGGALLGSAAGVITGVALARATDARGRQVAVPSLAGVLGAGAGLGFGLALPAESPSRASRMGAVIGSGAFLVGSMAAEPWLRLSDGLQSSWPAMATTGAAVGTIYGAMAAQLFVSDEVPGESARQSNGAMLTGASLGTTAGLVLASHFHPDATAYVTALGAATFGGFLGAGTSDLLGRDDTLAPDRRRPAFALAGSAIGLAGGALLAHHVTLRPPALVAGTVGAGYGALLGTLLPSLNEPSWRDGRTGAGGAQVGLALGGLAAAAAAEWSAATGKEVTVPLVGVGFGIAAGFGAGLVTGDDTSQPARIGTVAGALTFGAGALLAGRVLRLNEGTGPKAASLATVGAGLGIANGIWLAGALDGSGLPSQARGSAVAGGVLFGAATGIASGLALSKLIAPDAGDLSAVVVGSTLGAFLGRGGSMLLTEPGRSDSVATMAGSLAGFGALAAVETLSPLEGKDAFALTLGAGFGGAVGALVPTLSEATWPGWQRQTEGGLLLGTAAGALLATAARHSSDADGKTVFLGGLGAGYGMATGAGFGMLVEAEGGSGSRATRIGITAGTIVGGALGAGVWPRLEVSQRDTLMMLGLGSIGGWTGYWAPRLGHADSDEIGKGRSGGGLMAGAGTGVLLGTALTPLLDLDPDVLGDALALDLYFSGAGAGVGAIVSDRDDAPVWGMMAAGTAGLLIGGGLSGVIDTDEQHAPLLRLGSLEGLWYGAWLPSLLLDTDELGDRQRWGGVVAGLLGGRALAVLASPVLAPDGRTASLAGVGSAIGASVATGAALVGDRHGRERAALALGGTTIGLVGGALLAPQLDFREQGLGYGLAGAAVGAGEGLVFAWAGRADGDDDFAGSALIGAGVGSTIGLAAAGSSYLTMPRWLAAAGFGAWGAWMGSFGGALASRDPHEVTLGGLVGANVGFLAGYGLLRAEVVEPRDFGWLSLAGALGTVAAGGAGAALASREDPRPILAGLAVGPLIGFGAGALLLPKLRTLGQASSSAPGPVSHRRVRATRASVHADDGDELVLGATAELETSSDLLDSEDLGRSNRIARVARQFVDIGQWMPVVGALPSSQEAAGPPPFFIGVAGTLR